MLTAKQDLRRVYIFYIDISNNVHISYILSLQRPLSGKVERPLSDPLGEFIISELKASVAMNSDNSMIATAILGTVQLDDIRPDRQGKMTR